MSYAESLNSGKIGQSLTKSMDNIKLSSEVSPAEVQSMLYKYGKNQKQIQPQSQVSNQTQPQTQNMPQIQPQTQADSFTMNNTPKAQNIQTYQTQPNYTNYQPASYQAPLYNQPEQTQYQTPPNAQNVPIQYQNYQMTNSYPLVQTANNYAASTNAVNAYSAQNQPSANGQNLNVTTQNQAV